MPFVRVTSGLTNVCKTYFRLFACCTTFPEFNFTRLLETWKLIVQSSRLRTRALSPSQIRTCGFPASGSSQ